MTKIEPFKGVVYNSHKVKITEVVAPPYDIIPSKMQDALYRLSDYNIVRIELGKTEAGDSESSNKYTRAAGFFHKWLDEGVLVKDKAPFFYVYSMTYTDKGRAMTTWGFFGRMRIEDAKNSSVKPHEKTFAKPKEDRLNLIRQVKANISPVYVLFNDQGNRVIYILRNAARKQPLFSTRQSGVAHKFWRLDDALLINKIQKALLAKDVFIADGHHRFEVANMYRNEMIQKEGREGGYNHVMMYLAPINQKGLTIFPTHRMVKDLGVGADELLEKLAPYFSVKPVKSLKVLLANMAAAKEKEYLIGMHTKNKKYYLLKLINDKMLDKAISEDRSRQWKRLDVSILHGLIFGHILGSMKNLQEEGNIVYTRDPKEAVTEVDKGNYEIAFILNPTKITQVEAIAKEGEKMPHKSTYFYPKLLSGLVINELD